MGELLQNLLQAAKPHAQEKTKIRENSGYWHGEKEELPGQRQLLQYAEAFYGLARLFQELPCQQEKIGDVRLETVFDEIRAAVCRYCERGEGCWEKDYFESCSRFYELFAKMEEKKLTQRQYAPYYRQCPHAEAVVQCMEESLQKARMELMWSNRLRELRMAVGDEIYQTARLLKDMAKEYEELSGAEKKIAQKLKSYLRYLKVTTGNMRIFKNRQGCLEAYVSLRAEKQVCVSARTVAEVISECCQTAMKPAQDCCSAVTTGYSEFHFVQNTRYQLLCGISRITKDGEVVSGDNFSLLYSDYGQVVMSLADGMGSGVKACRVSEKMIEMTEQFLSSGFPQETAMRMIHSCMLLQGEEQNYSTMDLCVVDLHTGTCDFIKSGAAAAVLKRKTEHEGQPIFETIQSETFPPGVIWQSDYETVHRQLTSGDTIIMMTDGVWEALGQQGREEQMQRLICKAESPNAREYARRLMEKIYLMQQLEAKDDMTILVGVIWKKEDGWNKRKDFSRNEEYFQDNTGT